MMGSGVQVPLAAPAILLKNISNRVSETWLVLRVTFVATESLRHLVGLAHAGEAATLAGDPELEAAYLGRAEAAQ